MTVHEHDQYLIKNDIQSDKQTLKRKKPILRPLRDKKESIARSNTILPPISSTSPQLTASKPGIIESSNPSMVPNTVYAPVQYQPQPQPQPQPCYVSSASIYPWNVPTYPPMMDPSYVQYPYVQPQPSNVPTHLVDGYLYSQPQQRDVAMYQGSFQLKGSKKDIGTSIRNKSGSSHTVKSTNNGNKTVVHRSRKGCLTCRARKRKCDEHNPICHECSRLGIKCVWSSDVFKRRGSTIGNTRLRLDETFDKDFGVIKVVRGKVDYKVKNGKVVEGKLPHHQS